MDSSYAPASSPPAYGSAPALCVTNTAPLSPQVLAGLVSQLRTSTGSKSLLVRTVKGDSRQQGIEKEESVADMVTRAVEALFAEESLKVKPVEVLAEVETVFTEELEVKPVEVLAEVAGLVEIPDSCTDRPVWWPQMALNATRLSMTAQYLTPVACLMMIWKI